jgi:excisionase family DNA binding protein
MNQINFSPPRLSYTPDDAAEATGVSRTRIFMAIRDRELTARKAGKSTVIEAEELRRWLQSLPVRGRQPDAAECHSS